MFASLFDIFCEELVRSSVFAYCTFSYSVCLAVCQVISLPISQLVKLLVISPVPYLVRKSSTHYRFYSDEHLVNRSTKEVSLRLNQVELAKQYILDLVT